MTTRKTDAPAEKTSIDPLIRDLTAKLDNLERSVSQLHNYLEATESARDEKVGLLVKILEDERQNRTATSAQRTAWIEKTVKAVWEKGGQWLVFGGVVWVLAKIGVLSQVATYLAKP